MSEEWQPGRWRPLKNGSGTEWILEDAEQAEKEADEIRKQAEKVQRDNEFTERFIEYLRQRQEERGIVQDRAAAVKEELGNSSLEYTSMIKVKEVKLF